MAAPVRLAGPVYETVRVAEVLRKQHEAIDRLMAALLTREGELERAGLLPPEQMFVPAKSGFIWDAVVAGNLVNEMIERGCGVCL